MRKKSDPQQWVRLGLGLERYRRNLEFSRWVRSLRRLGVTVYE